MVCCCFPLLHANSITKYLVAKKIRAPKSKNLILVLDALPFVNFPSTKTSLSPSYPRVRFFYEGSSLKENACGGENMPAAIVWTVLLFSICTRLMKENLDLTGVLVDGSCVCVVNSYNF